MSKQSFLIDEAVHFGWGITKRNFLFFVGILLLILGIQLVDFLSALLFDLTDSFLGTLGELIVSLGVVVIGVIIGMGIIKVALNFCDNKENSFATLFSQYKLFFVYFLASVLYFIIVFLGIILLIIPGVYLAIRFIFFEYFIIDKKMGIVESLKESWKITQGKFWGVFAFSAALIALNILGALALLVGLLVTIPISIVAWAFVYRRISGIEGEEHNSSASTEEGVSRPSY